MDAFANSEYTYWWGPTTAMWSWQEERIRRRFADPGTQQFKVVDNADGTIVAWAKWDPPPQMTGLTEGFVVYDEGGRSISAGAAESGENEEAGPGQAKGKLSAKKYALGPPEGSNVALFKQFFDGIVGMEKKYEANKKLVLTHLCTRHSHHGRGIGSALLRSVLDLADREGLAAYLEGSRAGASLYKRFGFEVVDTLVFGRAQTGTDTTATLYIMIRAPQLA